MGVFYPQAAITLNILWEDFSFSSDATLQDTYSIPILAKSVSVNINDYSTADTFEATIDYKHFPFDPRMIRACGVTIHMQDQRKMYNNDNGLADLKPTTKNTLFQGFADEESISFDDDSRVVRIEGRDLTSILIDKKYPGPPLTLTNRLDVVLQGLLDELKETQKIDIVLRPETLEAELPILSSFFQDPEAAAKNIDRNETYWEVIQDVVSRAGLICFMELDKLILTKPQALYDATNAKVFVYGRNIKKLEFKRKIGRRKFFNIIIRSLVGKDVIEAKIPQDATAEWSKATGVSIGEVRMPEVGPKGQVVPTEKWKPAPYLSFRIPDCNSKDQLIKYAQEVYEEIGRQQIEGSFSTNDMETWTIEDALALKKELSSTDSFNILKLRNGTPIQIRIDQGDLKGLHDISDEDEERLILKRQRYLELRGYNSSIASAMARSMGKFVDIFYTKAVKFTLDNDNGFQADIEFINFIEAKKKPSGAP